MFFESLTALWLMDGHGVYVWSAIAIALVVLANFVLLPILSYRRALLQIRRLQCSNMAASPVDRT